MIPLRSENPQRSFAIVNMLLIALNVVIFIYQVWLPPRTAESLITTFGIVPARASILLEKPAGPRTLVEKDGAARSAAMTLVTAMFLHGGVLHLLGNMLFLWVFGGSVEGRLGHIAYLAFYLFCGIASGVTHILANWGSQVPSIGASGAISGVMGAYIVLFPLSRILTLIPLLIIFFTLRIPAFVILGYWFLIQFLSGLSTYGQANQGGVAWWAHIGGFAVGFLIGVVLRVDSAVS